MRVENLKKQESVVESVLFTMGQSVEIRQLAAALESDEETAIQAVERLKEKYDKRKAGMQIVRLDDSYQMCSRADYYENLIRVAATPKKQVLSDVVMETLAIIAYKQPVTKADIEKIRGVKSDHAVNRLVEYDWCTRRDVSTRLEDRHFLPRRRNSCAVSASDPRNSSRR